MIGKYVVRFAALGYLAALLAAPLGYVFWRTFRHGLGPAWAAVTTPDAVHALKVTLILTAIAVPANTIFGILAALSIVRYRSPVRGSSTPWWTSCWRFRRSSSAWRSSSSTGVV